MSTANNEEKILDLTMEEFAELLELPMPRESMKNFTKVMIDSPIMLIAMTRALIEGPDLTIANWFCLGFWMGYQKAKKDLEVSELERMSR